MRKLLKVLGATALLSGAVAPASVQAFGGPSIFSGAFKPIGVTGGATVCAFNPYNDPGFGEAEISFFSSAPGNTSVGGTWWSSSSSTTTFNAVTVADLETDCPFSNVVILSQVGADAANYSSEDLYELVWSATFDDDGQSYTYRVALEGVSTSAIVNTRTLNTAPNVAPSANAGSNQSVQSGTQVTLAGSGTDTDGTIALYAWTRSGGTGSAANAVLSDATAQAPTFTDSSVTSNDTAVTHIFSLVVTDDDGAASVADTVTITITPPPNAAPTATASAASTTVTSGTQVTLLGMGADTDGTIASYLWTRTGGTGSAANAFSTASAQNVVFTDSSLNVGDASVTHIFSLVVTDNDGAASPADSVTITITAPANTAPTAVAGATPNPASSGQTVTLNGGSSSANDAGQTLTYAWTQTAGTSVTLSSTTAVAPSFTAPTLVAGASPATLTFSLVVNDGVEDSVADTVDVTINPPANIDPTANAGADQTVASAATVTLDGSGSDANNAGQTLTYAWTQTSGTTVTLSSTTAEMPTFTAPTLAIGAADDTLIFNLTVNDGVSGSVADTVSITVEAPPNTPPTANAGPDQTVASGAGVTLDGTGSDANDAGQTLQYTWAQIGGPGVSLSSAAADMPTFTAPSLAIGAPDVTLTFQMTVSDGFDTSGIDTVVITVEAPANTAPVSNAGADQIVAPDATVTLDGTGSNANDTGQTLIYAWSQTAGTPVTLSSTTAANPTFTAENLVIGDADSVLTFSLTVNDGIEDSVADTVQITVDAPTNTVPTAHAGADQTVMPNASVTLDGTGSAPNDAGQTLTYVWSQTGGAAVSLSSTTAASPTFTAPNLVIGDADVILTFSLMVNDGFDASVADTVTISIDAPDNTVPTADAGTDQTVADGTTVTLDGSGSTANDAGQALTYAWTQTGGTVVSFNATAAQPSFTAPALSIGDADAVLTFSLVVDDGFDPSTADTVVVTVSAPADLEAPVITQPAPITLEAGPSAMRNVAFNATVTDNFDPVVTPVFTFDGNVITSPFDFPVGVNNVSVDAQDAAGNDATQRILVVTIEAGQAPSVPVITTSDINANRSLTIGGTAEADATVRVTFPNATFQEVTATGGTYAVTSAADMPGGTVTVIATDSQGNVSDAATVDLFPDYDGPTVTITGAPTRVVDETPFTIAVTFSEDVTGFEQSDIALTGGTITAFAGSGADYTAEITPIAGTPITISIAAGAAEDAFTNPSAAADTVSISNAALTETEEMVVAMAQTRTRSLISSQPRINRFLLGGQMGSFNANVTQGFGNFDFTTSSDYPVWVAGQGRWTTEDETESTYANVVIGGHVGLGENVLLGAMAQIDTFEADEGDGQFDSTGWLVGPYAVMRAPNQPLVFSTSYLVGKSDNTISPLGTFEDSFESDRSLFTLGVAGEIALERVTLIPLLDLMQATEESEAYTDGNSVDVRAQEVTTTEATLGLDFIVPLNMSEGRLELLGGFGATSSMSDNGIDETEATRGRAELGFRYDMENGGRVSGRTIYDGIGQDDYEAIGAELAFEISF